MQAESIHFGTTNKSSKQSAARGAWAIRTADTVDVWNATVRRHKPIDPLFSHAAVRSARSCLVALHIRLSLSAVHKDPTIRSDSGCKSAMNAAMERRRTNALEKSCCTQDYNRIVLSDVRTCRSIATRHGSDRRHWSSIDSGRGHITTTTSRAPSSTRSCHCFPRHHFRVRYLHTVRRHMSACFVSFVCMTFTALLDAREIRVQSLDRSLADELCRTQCGPQVPPERANTQSLSLCTCGHKKR